MPKAALVRVDGKVVKPKVVARAARQPFQNSGGEPIGVMLEVKIPVAPVSKGHVVEVR
jgi:hypothetical protein